MRAQSAYFSAASRQRKRSVLNASGRMPRKQTLAEVLHEELLPAASDHNSPARSAKQSLSPTPKHILLDARPQSNCFRRRQLQHRKIIPEAIPYADPTRTAYRLNTSDMGSAHSHSECKLHPTSSPKHLAVIQLELQQDDPPPRRTYSRALSRLKPKRAHCHFYRHSGEQKQATAETNTEEMDFPSHSPVSHVNYKFFIGDQFSSEHLLHVASSRRPHKRRSQRRLI